MRREDYCTHQASELDPTRKWNPVNPAVGGMTNQPSQRSWAQVAADNTPLSQSRESTAGNGGEKGVSWSQRFHLLYEAAGDSGQTGVL